MPSRDQRLLTLSTVCSSALVLVAAFAGFEELVAYAAPLLVLALPLLGGRYLGEERITRAAGRRRQSRVRPRAVMALRSRPRQGLSVPRGGRLIACALAVRPPPALGLLR